VGIVVLKLIAKLKQEIFMESFLPLGGTCETREEHPYATSSSKAQAGLCMSQQRISKSLRSRISCALLLGFEINIRLPAHSCFCPSAVLLLSKSHTALQNWTSTVHEFANKIGGMSDGTTRISLSLSLSMMMIIIIIITDTCILLGPTHDNSMYIHCSSI